MKFFILDTSENTTMMQTLRQASVSVPFKGGYDGRHCGAAGVIPSAPFTDLEVACAAARRLVSVSGGDSFIVIDAVTSRIVRRFVHLIAVETIQTE